MRSLTCNPVNRKRLLASTLFVCTILTASGQEVRRFEGEVGAAVPVAAKKYGSKYEPGWHIYAEGRYNFRSQPVDVGLQFEYGTFYRDWDSGHSRNYHFNTLLAVADYNFRRTKNISPFVGLGAGCSFITVDNADFATGATHEHEFSACVMPRVGVEFFHHIRITFGYRLRSKEYSNAEVALGIVFGGGRKR